MPRGDGTGPLGQGPMTGKGEGFCILRLEGCGNQALKGFAGLRGRPVYETTSNRKEAAMPAGNGTGPAGMGPMTGRAAGLCADYGVPGYMNPIPGRGIGMGFGRCGGRGNGRGWRNMFYATGLAGWQRAAAGRPMMGGVPPTTAGPTHEQQLDALKGQTEHFEGVLGDIRTRIEKLEAASR